MLRLPALALLSAASLAIGCDDGHTHEVDLENGRQIHDDTCMVAGCHPDNGVMFEEHIPEHTDDQLFDIISMGTEEMPAQTQLSDQDIQDVIAYLRTIYP